MHTREIRGIVPAYFSQEVELQPLCLFLRVLICKANTLLVLGTRLVLGTLRLRLKKTCSSSIKTYHDR